MKTGFWILIAIVAFMLVGWAVIGFTLHLAWSLLIGLIVGALGRTLVTGSDNLGLFATAVAGLGGSMGGGLVAEIMDAGWIIQVLLSIIGAAVLVVLFRGPRSDTPS